MAYRFNRTDAGLAEGITRIVQEETERAGAELSDPELPIARKIHQARKRTKRLRGLFRLVRPEFPAYDEENAHLRAAARNLSRLRDRDVMIATHDRLMEDTGAERRRYAAIRAHLTRARNRVAAAQDPDAALEEYIGEMQVLEGRAPDWTLTAKDRPTLEAGLTRTWGRARRAMKAAKKGTDIEDLHEWRKRVKDHWYQARLLTPIAPGMLKPQAEAAGELGEILGDIHDLDVYRNHLQGPEASGLNMDRRAELVTLASDRIKALEATAFAMGKRIFKQDETVLAKEWASLWKAWRKGPVVVKNAA